MAETVKDIKEWLDNFNPNEHVGIDEGGLSLRIVEDMYCYFEIGGIPEGIEDEWNANR